jgi:hypothetical protein
MSVIACSKLLLAACSGNQAKPNIKDENGLDNYPWKGKVCMASTGEQGVPPVLEG